MLAVVPDKLQTLQQPAVFQHAKIMNIEKDTLAKYHSNAGLTLVQLDPIEPQVPKKIVIMTCQSANCDLLQH